MYVSTNWLKAILNLTHVNLITIKERLTSSGFEVEETKILKILNQPDIILDLKTITNRPDILSIIGLTNEISSLIYINFKKVNLKKANFNFFKININKIQSANNFSSTIYFISSNIENIQIEKIQPWIKKRLISSNIIPENNLNDLSKYCLLEWGQPIFLYDLDKIKKLTKSENPKIKVRFAKIGETFIDSNSINYKLTEQTLLVVANNIPISVAGSLISKDCNIDCFTKSIMIELSSFDPKVFRNSERSVGIRTIMSVFYERGISPFLLKPSYNRFLNLVLLFNTDFSFKNTNNFIYIKELFYKKKIIPLSFKNIEYILGNFYSKEQKLLKTKVFECLNQMRFDFVLKESYCNVIIPLTRYSDIEEEIDLIEEISRFIGFDNFKSMLLKVKQVGKLSKYENLKRKFRHSFLNLGFTEVFNYSLISQENLNNPIIINPLIFEYSCLRTNLISQLIKSLEKNIAQGNKVLPIFEIGRVFKIQSNYKFLETELLCGIFVGTNYKILWSEKDLILNWFQMKTSLENLLINLQINYIFEKKNIISEFYNPKNCLSIIQNNQEIGIFGSINPKFSSIKGLTSNCFLFEIELTKILHKNKTLLYKNYSVYPSLIVDLSLIVPKQITFSQINLIIQNAETSLIDKIEVFDLYEKGNFNNNCYSLGIKIAFKSKYKTLLKTDIDLILLKIQNELKQNLNIDVRI